VAVRVVRGGRAWEIVGGPRTRRCPPCTGNHGISRSATAKSGERDLGLASSHVARTSLLAPRRHDLADRGPPAPWRSPPARSIVTRKSAIAGSLPRALRAVGRGMRASAARSL